MSIDVRLVKQLGFEHIEIKPNSASGISHESTAGLNVKLTSNIEKQIAKDSYLINAGRIKGAEWHFWRGAQPELIQALQKAGIKAVVH
jgi:hypothetical protein